MDLYGTGAVPADAVQGLLDDAGAFADEGGRDDFQDLRASVYECPKKVMSNSSASSKNSQRVILLS